MSDIKDKTIQVLTAERDRYLSQLETERKITYMLEKQLKDLRVYVDNVGNLIRSALPHTRIFNKVDTDGTIAVEISCEEDGTLRVGVAEVCQKGVHYVLPQIKGAGK